MISIQYFLLALTILGFPMVSAYWKPTPGLTWNWVLGTNPNNLPL